MKKLLTIVGLITAATSCAPAYSQQLTLDQMVRMNGGYQPHLSTLQSKYDTRGMQVNVNARGASASASVSADYGYRPAYNYAPASEGNSGDYGNQTSNTYAQAQDGNTVSNYNYETANQSPWSRGGLPETNTAVTSLNGGFGDRFGKTQIPTGRFKYGFGDYKPRPYRGVSGNPFVRGRNLPPVSTASVNLNIVDR